MLSIQMFSRTVFALTSALHASIAAEQKGRRQRDHPPVCAVCGQVDGDAGPGGRKWRINRSVFG